MYVYYCRTYEKAVSGGPGGEKAVTRKPSLLTATRICMYVYYYRPGTQARTY